MYLLGSRSLVGDAVIRLGLGGLGTEDLLDVKAVTALPIVGLCWIEVLIEVLRHIAKSIVTQVLVSRGSRCSSASE